MAAAKEEVRALDEVEEVLMCQVCLDPMVDRYPRQLKCLHTFCTPCLETIKLHRNRNENRISCPTCRLHTELQNGKISDLPLNFTIQQAKEMARSMSQAQLCFPCSMKEEYIQATVKCTICDRRLCGPCVERHNKFAGFKDHALIQLTNIVVADVNNCKQHNRHYSHFCQECHSLLCTDCVLSEDHVSHPGNVEDIAQAARTLRTGFLRGIDRCEKKLTANKGRYEKELQRVTYFERVKNDITKCIKDMKNKIDEEGNTLIKEQDEKYCIPSCKRVQLFAELLELTRGMHQSMSTEKSDCEIIMEKRTISLKEREIEALEKRIEVLPCPPLVKFMTGKPPTLGTLVQHNEVDDVSPGMTKAVGDTTPTLLKRFSANEITCDSGVGALENNIAVLVSKAKQNLVIYHLENGLIHESHQTGPVTYVSAYYDRILYAHGTERTLYEARCQKSRALTLTKRKKYFTPCSLISRFSFDSKGNILLTNDPKNTCLKKYDPDNDLLWYSPIQSRYGVNISVVSSQDVEVYVISESAESRVTVVDVRGKEMCELKLQRGKEKPSPESTTSTPKGTILVADSANHTVNEYSVDGAFLRNILTEAEGIKYPRCISFDSSGCLWITESKADECYYGLVVYKLKYG